MRGLLGDDLTVGGCGVRPISGSMPSVVRSMPFSRQSCLFRKRLRLAGGPACSPPLPASPADWARVRVRPEAGTVSEVDAVAREEDEA